MQDWFSKNPFEGLKDVIAAYSSLSLYYDPVRAKMKNQVRSSVYEFISLKLAQAWHNSSPSPAEDSGHTLLIPVCYDDEFGQDLPYISATNHLTREEIIRIHTSDIYYVYMIGFLPGFAYMAEVNERLVIPRKPVPVQVAPGSVGIAGNQTGIYPLACPGGWQIVGRTTFRLFDPSADKPAVLKPGDRVQFYEISREEYESGSLESSTGELVMDKS
jgi:inhibitor of KinA